MLPGVREQLRYALVDDVNQRQGSNS